MASPRLTFRSINTPTRQRKKDTNISTPSKRTKFRELFKDGGIEETPLIARDVDTVKVRFRQCKPADLNAQTLLADLACTYLFDVVHRLLAGICHVPQGFSQRDTYISKIVNCEEDFMQLDEMVTYIKMLEPYVKGKEYMLTDSYLWKCTKKYKEGFLFFIVPPVNRCVECEGELYTLNKVQITMFTLQGPKPGMKTTLRCKKGCGSCYNIDRYTTDGITTFYQNYSPHYINASNCVYMKRDVHELICESANHGFVSHHAFTEIYNALFAKSLNGAEFKQLVNETDGCESLRVIDSCWKVCMPHCMYAVEMVVEGLPLVIIPNVCTNEPKPNSVFCQEHHQLLEENSIPTEKSSFLKYIGCKENPSSPVDIESVDRNTIQLARQLKTQNLSRGCTTPVYQGTASIVTKIEPSKLAAGNMCNKDIGQKSHLRQRSRGHFISVTGGGHIQYFAPIFKSESPSQIFLIVLRVMILEFSKVPPQHLDAAMEKYVLAYDNMCQLNSLRAAKEPLPFPAPYDLMWQKIKKIIDRLHIKNHKDAMCHDIYNPDQIPEGHTQ